MAKDKKNILAIDCGNSSLRVVLGEFDGSASGLSDIRRILSASAESMVYESGR